jgi:hypothetical protein
MMMELQTNKFIPKPGPPGCKDECPPIYYSMALMQHLRWIWHLRLTWPWENIIQYVDDIQAAFHPILYHPDASIIFVVVFSEFLIILIGTIFWSIELAVLFTLLLELRANVASYTTYWDNESVGNLTALTW